jgi:hypothetical protein
VRLEAARLHTLSVRILCGHVFRDTGLCQALLHRRECLWLFPDGASGVQKHYRDKSDEWHVASMSQPPIGSRDFYVE